ncbi:MAG: DUF3025 domain-containing protein [Gammaproteobacteria bacterium]|nr:DUF3025 domain-containing protein [Gammaproteobacteria bacterium]
MSRHTGDKWNPDFLTMHRIFWPIAPFAQTFVQTHGQWPTLDAYQQFLELGAGRIYSGSGKLLRFVAQSAKPDRLEETYEPRIYLQGEIQTRLNNWHDFFQVMIWRMFPKSKTSINERHYQAIKERAENDSSCLQRSALENALTQFDECGAVILSSEPELLELVKNFQWKTLFWEQRNRVRNHLKCIVFGHAIYEKALNPYVGMTAHSVLLPVTPGMLSQSTVTLIDSVDELLTELFRSRGTIASPADFSPFPLLGMPGWDTANDQEAYYNNTRYFRPGRQYKT